MQGNTTMFPSISHTQQHISVPSFLLGPNPSFNNIGGVSSLEGYNSSRWLFSSTFTRAIRDEQ